MIKRLKLHNIGPARDLEADFAQRLNLITGDNGLGKTFLLDACWYGLTKRTWADDKPFYPGPGAVKSDPPRIDYTVVGEAGKVAESHAEFQFSSQSWKGKQGRPSKPGLVIYARIDGGFSVWDPARNYWRDKDDDVDAESVEDDTLTKQPKAYQFSKSEVWNGKPEHASDNIVSNGLIRDVESWRLKGNGVFDLLQKVLEVLSTDEGGTLRIGEGVRVKVGDAREFPTLVLPYGNVPVTQAAAGMRRVLALAYLLVWAWEEHKRAAELIKEEPTRRLVLLFDEVEAHLHPKWQRVFLPAVLKVAQSLLLQDAADSVQIIATTHAPLVLGSVETLWDEDQDQLFDFDLEGDQVKLEGIGFEKHGGAEHWLSSVSFDLPHNYGSYSVDAQKAMERADVFMQNHQDPKALPLEEMEATHKELLRTLGGDDEYWPYWLPFYDDGRVQA